MSGKLGGIPLLGFKVADKIVDDVLPGTIMGRVARKIDPHIFNENGPPQQPNPLNEAFAKRRAQRNLQGQFNTQYNNQY